MPRVVSSGRYKGQLYTDVVAHHRPYCLWVLESTDLPTGLRAFQAWLKSRHGGVMAVGKHRYKLFREIVDEDPSYCVWASELQSPTESMQLFQAYLLKHELTGVEPQDQSPKRRRVASEEPERTDAGHS